MKNFPSILGNSEASGLEVINQTVESIPVEGPLLKEILQHMEKRFGVRFQMIELVYVDENEIVRINREFLGKEYITDRKSTRLKSSHVAISYAVFSLKKKTNHNILRL